MNEVNAFFIDRHARALPEKREPARRRRTSSRACARAANVSATYLLHAVRELFGQPPLAARCFPEWIAAARLWMLRYVPERPGAFEVAAA